MTIYKCGKSIATGTITDEQVINCMTGSSDTDFFREKKTHTN